jgi:hypothetical protein
MFTWYPDTNPNTILVDVDTTTGAVNIVEIDFQ